MPRQKCQATVYIDTLMNLVMSNIAAYGFHGAVSSVVDID